jgi:hypothetical protein
MAKIGCLDERNEVHQLYHQLATLKVYPGVSLSMPGIFHSLAKTSPNEKKLSYVVFWVENSFAHYLLHTKSK